MPGSIIASYLVSAGVISAGIAATATAFAINMVASAVIARVFAPDEPTINSSGGVENPGSRITAPPAGDNKLPVVYGSAYVGGAVIDMSITSDSQTIYYVIALSEVTNTETGGTPDTFTFGNIYYGGKRVIFDGTDLTKVNGLLDESTGLTDTTVAGKINFYLYRNGSNNPVNTTLSASSVISGAGVVYAWDASKQMSNCVFAIIKLRYSVTANIRGLDSVRFQITNSRSAPGSCLLDYLSSERYGAALSLSNIDTTSLTALNVYSAQTITYTPYTGGSSTIARFRFDGVINTQQPIMSNIQLMANSCDCLVRYNEITSKWGVIVQQPTYTVAMALNDSNIISGLSISPLDISNTFNIAEVKFPDGTVQDSFASVTYDLSVIDPALLYPNEPVNKQEITLAFVNNNVRAQLLANRFLKSCREDLQVQAKINYVGLQLEAGDIVTVTNTNYGWTAKLFRIQKVVEDFGGDGSITASLILMEFNPAVYNDVSITEFIPAPNTGLGDPLTFGTIPVPTIGGINPNAANPSFQVNVTSSSDGIVQYAEVWYSAFVNPTAAQRIFAGTTAIESDGNPYAPSTALPPVTLAGISAGNWYFFSRMVNQLGSSNFSGASALLQWRPTTFTYDNRYLVVAYGDDLVGTGLSASPIGKNYYGLFNTSTASFSSNPADYTWYLAQPTFGSANKLCYINRTGRTFSFGTAPAAFAASTAAYVPTSTFDASIWSALPDGTNSIDLDIRTGQLLTTGTTTVGGGEISIVNNPNGTLVGSLSEFLDFGGSSTYTGSGANLTIDVYGRVVGLTAPDSFNFTSWEAVATAGQTVFTPTTRNANYINGQDWVFRNGILLVPTSEYTETTTSVTMVNPCVVGDAITIVSFRSTSNTTYYANLDIAYSSGTGTNTLTYSNLPSQLINPGDVLTFSNTGTPTQYTVSSINYATKQIVFTTTFTASIGNSVYRYRFLGATYRTFSRWDVSLSAVSSYSPTEFQIVSGAEIIFLNGTLVNDQDYDLASNVLNNFPAPLTGNLTIFQFAHNGFGVPNGSPAIVSTFTVNGQSVYSFSYDVNAFELYLNGCLGVSGIGKDYTTATGTYALNPTPNNNTTVLSQQTFNRTGAA
jgi:hypothetical protein